MARTAPHAFSASREHALRISNVRQSDRCEAATQELVEQLCKDKDTAAHLRETRKGNGDWLRDPSLAEGRCTSREVAANCRLRLRAQHKALAHGMKCSGCGKTLAADALAAHVVGCSRIHGFNVSSRHAHFKTVLASILQDAGVPFDRAEPREYKSSICPGCGGKFATDAGRAHFATCTDLSPLQKKAGPEAARRTGPDGRCTIDGVTYVYDVTVVSSTAPSYIGEKEGHALRLRETEKHKLYSAAAAANGHTLIVLGATALGQLSATTIGFLKQVCATSHGRITLDTARSRLTTAIAMSTGRVLSDAESRLGVIHRTTSPQIALTSGRGDVEAAAATVRT